MQHRNAVIVWDCGTQDGAMIPIALKFIQVSFFSTISRNHCFDRLETNINQAENCFFLSPLFKLLEVLPFCNRPTELKSKKRSSASECDASNLLHIPVAFDMLLFPFPSRLF